MRPINDPSVLKGMSVDELNTIADELREEIIQTVSRRGGHLASNLGSVEMIVALHTVFDAPEDKLIFDVGHQAYAHKLLTGRLEGFQNLRRRGGVSGFPQMAESEYDSFTAGHASTAISAALGMARTRDVMRADYHVVAVVGDGALTGGMCYEALNDAGQSNTRLIVVLNDNEMSISRNVGAMSRYLTRLRQSKTYSAVKRGVRRGLNRIPVVGLPISSFIERIKDSLKTLLLDGKFFSALGFEYIGPIDGHDIKHMIRVLNRAKASDKPTLIHLVTQKGKGYQPAEAHPEQYHGVVPFYIESGEARDGGGGASNGEVACRMLCELADKDIRICAVTAAMTDGTGLTAFQKAFPSRFFDVGIAEEHAVTMAAGMAATGMRPYVAIYSTFLQRAYDQILTDVCRNRLPVTFLIDRAGLVGADGQTHQGTFDLSWLRTMPNMVVSSPRDARDLKRLIQLSLQSEEPFAIRYPKSGDDLGPGVETQHDFAIGEWELLSDGEDVIFFAVGRMVQQAMQATVELLGKGVRAGVVDARFVKPMDERLLLRCAGKVRLVVTVEENTLEGGFGEGVAEAIQRAQIDVRVLSLGVPDRFIGHGSVQEQLEECGLTGLQIAERVLRCFHENERTVQ